MEDPHLGLGPVIRGELLLRGVNDPAGPSKNGEAQSLDTSGRGQLLYPHCQTLPVKSFWFEFVLSEPPKNQRIYYLK